MKYYLNEGDEVVYCNSTWIAKATGMHLINNFKRQMICRSVHIQFNSTLKQLRTASRKAGVVNARHALCYYLSMYTNMGLEDVGNYIHRDHATVLHSVNTWKDWISTYPEYREIDARITERIRGV